MRLYGIASDVSQDIDDFYLTLEEAQAAVAQVVIDAPELEGRISVMEIDFALSPN